MIRAERSTSAARLASALGRLLAVSKSSASEIRRHRSVPLGTTSSLSERGSDAERGQKQACLFCYG
jgi:hypothetical protein